jgi:hypothetical protein
MGGMAIGHAALRASGFIRSTGAVFSIHPETAGLNREGIVSMPKGAHFFFRSRP